MMMAFRILLVLGCAAYVLVGVRRRSPGLGLSFLGLGLITASPLISKEEETAGLIGWIGTGIILLAGVLWIVLRFWNRRQKTG